MHSNSLIYSKLSFIYHSFYIMQVNLQDLKIYYMENEGGNPLVSPVNKEIRKAQKKVFNLFFKLV